VVPRVEQLLQVLLLLLPHEQLLPLLPLLLLLVL
jgi:hypothetical protein